MRGEKMLSRSAEPSLPRKVSVELPAAENPISPVLVKLTTESSLIPMTWLGLAQMLLFVRVAESDGDGQESVSGRRGRTDVAQADIAHVWSPA